MSDPGPEIRALAQAAGALYAKMPPNSARAFSAVVALLSRKMNQDVAERAAREALPGSYRAWRREKDARQARLMSAVKRGRIN